MFFTADIYVLLGAFGAAASVLSRSVSYCVIFAATIACRSVRDRCFGFALSDVNPIFVWISSSKESLHFVFTERSLLVNSFTQSAPMPFVAVIISLI